MLAADFVRRDAQSEQAEAVVATGSCNCGCATIDLQVERAGMHRAQVKSRVLSKRGYEWMMEWPTG
jgi:hypothetical protein